MTAGPGGVQFLVVGSPRSGTTVIQRLACELPGVGMPPETHFFTRFAAGLLARHRFPVSGTELATVVADLTEMGSGVGYVLDPDALVADLGGLCHRPWELFDAVVRQLAGPAEVWGEKTPDHLVWWRPISRAAPWVRFVTVVRDPRAVVASSLEMPWRTDATLPSWGARMHLVFAELWSFFQGQVLLMVDELGPQRCLVVRYEDAVGDPDATRARLAAFLGRPAGDARRRAPAGIVLPSETWKARALEPVDDSQVDSWRERLDARRAADVAVVCRTRMRAFGYGPVPSPWSCAVGWLRFAPRTWFDLARYARARGIHLRAVERASL